MWLWDIIWPHHLRQDWAKFIRNVNMISKLIKAIALLFSGDEFKMIIFIY